MIATLSLNAQDTIKKSRREIKAEKEALLKEQTKKLLDSKNYMFVTKKANPSRGGTIDLTGYTVKITGDTIVSFLPYYGRTYIANLDNQKSPYDFTQVAESYNLTKVKKGYKVEINVKKEAESITYSFDISDTGFASLTAISSSRQPISYTGDIVEIRNR
jgi:hypothetical protein